MGIVDKISAKLAGHDSEETNESHSTHHHNVQPGVPGGKITEGTVIDPNPDVGAVSIPGQQSTQGSHHISHPRDTANTNTIPTSSAGKTDNVAARHSSHPVGETSTYPSNTIGTEGLGSDRSTGAHNTVTPTSHVGQSHVGTGSQSGFNATAAKSDFESANMAGAHKATGAHSSSEHYGTTGAHSNVGSHSTSGIHSTTPGVHSNTGAHSTSGAYAGNANAHTTGVHSSTTGTYDDKDKKKVNDLGEPIVEKNAVTSEVRHEKNKGNTMTANLAQSADEFDRKAGRLFGKETLTGADKGVGTEVLQKKEKKEMEKEHDAHHSTSHHGTTGTAGTTGIAGNAHGTTSSHGGAFGSTSGTAYDRQEGVAYTGSHPTTTDDIIPSHKSERTAFEQGIATSTLHGSTATHGHSTHPDKSYSNPKEETMNTSVPVHSSTGAAYGHDHSGASHGLSGSHHDDTHYRTTDPSYKTTNIHGHDATATTPRTAEHIGFTTGNTTLDEKVARLDVKGQQQAKDAYQKGYQDGIHNAH